MGKKQLYYFIVFSALLVVFFITATRVFESNGRGDIFTADAHTLNEQANVDAHTLGEATRLVEVAMPTERSTRWHRPNEISLLIEHNDELNHPDSEEDIEWLNRNGYPSMAAFEDGSRNFFDAEYFDDSTDLAAVGMVKAEIFSSTFPDRADSSIKYLQRAAASGSVYALEALSRFHANELNGNPIISAAYLRAAEIRGNWALSSHGPALSVEDRYLANLYAQRILSDLDRGRAREGRGPLGRSLRPGLEDFLNRVEAARDEGDHGQ